jgi:hypothetical protein
MVVFHSQKEGFVALDQGDPSMKAMLLTLVLPLFLGGPLSLAQSAWHTIHNDFYWLDQNGQRILRLLAV